MIITFPTSLAFTHPTVEAGGRESHDQLLVGASVKALPEKEKCARFNECLASNFWPEVQDDF